MYIKKQAKNYTTTPLCFKPVWLTHFFECTSYELYSPRAFKPAWLTCFWSVVLSALITLRVN